MTFPSDGMRLPDPEPAEDPFEPRGDAALPEGETVESGAGAAADVEPSSGAAVPTRPLSPAAAAARARDAAIAESILRLVAERGPARSICPSEAAREVAAAEGRAEWHPLMGNVRRIAGLLQAQGRVEILRKGRPAAADVRGVIRLRQAQAGGAGADPAVPA